MSIFLILKIFLEQYQILLTNHTMIWIRIDLIRYISNDDSVGDISKLSSEYKNISYMQHYNLKSKYEQNWYQIWLSFNFIPSIYNICDKRLEKYWYSYS